MKISTSEVKKWTVLVIDGDLYRVLDTSHTHTWRWSATYTFRVKNLRTGNVKDVTYKSGAELEAAEVNTKNAVYLYNTGDSYAFMENDTSEIYEIPAEQIEDIIPYLKENLDVFLMIHDWNVIGVILPPTIEYKIVETVPGVKWDRATTWKKWAKLETGLEVQVPLHKKEGDTVIVNTLTGEAS